MYQLLALDMDGTLLDRNKYITPSVQQSLQTFMNQGRLVTIASGRFPASVWLHARALDLNAPLIALNGAAILDETTGQLIKGYPIPSSDIEKLAHFIESQGAYIHFYGYNTLYVAEVNEMNQNWPLANVVVSPDKPLTLDNYQDQIHWIQVEPVGSLSYFASSTPVPLYKATVIHEDAELIDQWEAELQRWSIFTITRTGRHRFDVNALGISKRSALEQVSHDYLIPQVQVAAMGDYDNDIEMLQWAGLGIAMGNAEEHVKQIAGAVTTSNEQDGVAHAVMNYLLY